MFGKLQTGYHIKDCFKIIIVAKESYSEISTLQKRTFQLAEASHN